MGNAIVLAFGKYPLKAVFTPIFKTTAYNDKENVQEVIEEQKRYFDEREYEQDFFFCATVNEKNDLDKKQRIIEERLDEKDKIDDTVNEVIDTKRKIYIEIDETLTKYENTLSERDYLYLKQSSFNDKLIKLRELAKMAFEEGKRVLGLDLQKTATLLEVQYAEKIEKIEQKEGKNV